MNIDDEETARAEWVEVATFSTGLEADMAKNALEQAEIPVLVRSNASGIFGLAFQGVVAGGIALQVPSPEFDRARELLSAQETRDLALMDDDEDEYFDPGPTPADP
jgi:Putative prokaryotic signal transducing protein